MAKSPCLEPPEVAKLRKHSRITLAAAREIGSLNGDDYINVIKSYLLQKKDDKKERNKPVLMAKVSTGERAKEGRIERLLDLRLKHMKTSQMKLSPKRVDEYHDDFEDLDDKIDSKSPLYRMNYKKVDKLLPISNTTTLEIKDIARKDFAPRRLVDEAHRRQLSLAQLIKTELFASKSVNTLKSPSHSDSRPKSAGNRLYNSTSTPIATSKLHKFAIPIHYSIYNKLPRRSILITIEQCCDCNYHISLKHDESVYNSYSEQALSNIISCVLNHEKIANYYNIGIAKVSYCDSKSNRPKTATPLNYRNSLKPQVTHSRVGALEIQCVIKNESNEIKLLHSKLSSKLWPNVASIEHRLDSFLYEHEQSLNDSSSTVSNGSNLFDKYATSNQLPIDEIVWIIKHQVVKAKRDKVLIEKIAYHDLV